MTGKKNQKSAADGEQMLHRVEIWTIFPAPLSAGRHLSRTEMKKTENIWLDLRLILMMILPKDWVLVANNICYAFFMCHFINQKATDTTERPEMIWMSFPGSLQWNAEVRDHFIWLCYHPHSTSVEYWLHWSCSRRCLQWDFCARQILAMWKVYSSLVVQYANTLQWCKAELTYCTLLQWNSFISASTQHPFTHIQQDLSNI